MKGMLISYKRGLVIRNSDDGRSRQKEVQVVKLEEEKEEI